MQRVPTARYPEIGSLFAHMSHQPIVKSILAGNTKGEVYSDCTLTPKSSMINGMGFEILVAGDAGNTRFNQEAANYVADKVVPIAKKAGAPHVTIYPETDVWAHMFQKKLGEMGKQADKKSKRFYTLERQQFKKDNKELPNHATLTAINASVLKDETLLNREYLRQWIDSSWTSVESFLKKGIGYCVIEGDVIVHWCLAVFAADRKLEFALMTVAGYEGKGYAKAGASACMEKALSMGKQPLWNCNKDNGASIAVAKSLGFKQQLDYEVLEIRL
ncbi:GNAT family N-acetyltransferase [Shouchella tritolerans]|uniref:GNAT family N-acetyltransferase n=1 Tax=Shouchella tritolerans TaxID=2979466 RepID=UPI0021E84B32|nr:GNAT family N-acetyltransferase [Shouchella tritolerans]